MSRKIYLSITTNIIVHLEDDETIDDVISNMDYNFSYIPTDNEGIPNDTERIEYTEIYDYEIKDVK